MIFYDSALEYWKIAKRCRAHRETNPAIVPTAVRDMQRLLADGCTEAVRKRVNSFIAANRTKPPRDLPPSGGPRYA
jgi:hypothetical protein